MNYCADKKVEGYKWGNLRISQNEQARKYGASEIHSWDTKMLHDTPLYRLNKKLFDRYSMAGTLWRPYIILRTMFKTDCEVILYLDCDLAIIDDLHKITDHLEKQDVIIPQSPWLHGQFFRREAAILMEADTKEYYNMQQLYGGIMAFNNNDVAKSFLLDLFTATSYPNMSTAYEGNPSIEEHPNFHKHRNQGIMTILYHRYGFRQYPEELIDITDLRAQGGATTTGYVVEKMQ